MNNDYERQAAESIRANYVPHEQTKLDKLRKLDKKVSRPAEIFAYTFGVIGALVLGVGMCLAMKILGDLMPLGIVIGIVGIAMVSVNYFIYNKILNKRRKKFEKQVLSLSDEVIGIQP